MFRHLRIHRGLCLALMVPLVAGPAFGAEGVVYDLTGPGCPNCRSPGSPPCPANVKYFGYYPTRWRPWPGTEPTPTPAEQPQPNHVEVPSAEQEAVGKPGAATGDTGTATPPATGSPTDPNSSNTPTTPGRRCARDRAAAQWATGPQRSPVAKRHTRAGGDAPQRRSRSR